LSADAICERVGSVTRTWELTPRQSVEAECRRRGDDTLVAGCVDILDGGAVDGELLGVLAGPAAATVLDGAEGGPTGYWPRVWALRALLYAWSDDATPAVVLALDDPSWRVREMAARVVARRVVGPAFDALVDLRHDPTPRVRAAADRALTVLVEERA